MTTTKTGIDSRTLVADAVESASEAVKAARLVKAGESDRALLAQYAEAKRAMDAAEARIDALKPKVNALFEAKSADKFTDSEGTVLMSRSECLNRQEYDIPMLARLAPKALAKATKARTTHFRLNLPRIKA